MTIYNSLKKLRKKAYQQLKDSIDRRVTTAGGCSQVYFTQLNQQEAVLPVAFSVPINGISPARVGRKVLRGQKLLANKRVHSPFIYNLLYFNEQGSKVSPKAEQDLMGYLNEAAPRSMEMDLIRRLIGQLILAVAALHEKHLVHRDIKYNNCLVTHREGKVYLQLADLDEVCEVDPTHKNHAVSGVRLAGTEAWLPPELKHAHVYLSIDLKAVDCYALGALFKAMVDHCCLPEQALEDAGAKVARVYLKQMIESMMKADPDQRPSLDQLKANPLFGGQPFLCEKFFASLTEEAEQELSVDGYYCRYPQVNDDFYLLPSALKQIVESAEILINQLRSIEEFDTNDIIFHSLLFEKMVTHKNELIQLILATSENASLQSLAPELNDLLNAVQEELPDITLPSLHRIVESSVKEFIEVNKLQKKQYWGLGWFSRYHAVDKMQAEQFLSQMKAMIVEKRSLREVFTLVHRYIVSDPEHTYSLSRILKHKLSQLSSLPLDKWTVRLEGPMANHVSAASSSSSSSSSSCSSQLPQHARSLNEQIIDLSLSRIKLV